MSTFVSNSAILAVLAILLVNIIKADSNVPVYIRYVRRRPSWFPSDLYMEEVVEEFRTINKPPMFGSSEDDIQQFLEADQNVNQHVRDKYKISNSSSREERTYKQLKASITTTIHKPDSVRLKFREFDDSSSNVQSTYKTTTEQFPYTIVLPESAEFEYYDAGDYGSAETTSERTAMETLSTTTVQPTTKQSFSLFGFRKMTSSPSPSETTSIPLTTTMKTYTTSSNPSTRSTLPMFSWFGKSPTTDQPGTSRYSDTTSDGSHITSTTTTTTNDNLSASSTYSTLPRFNWFGPLSTTTPTTTSTKPQTFSQTSSTIFTALTKEDDKTPTTDAYDEYNSHERKLFNTTTTFTPLEYTIERLDSDYVNGEVIGSAEVEEISTTLSPNVTTTTKKSGLLWWG